MIISESSYPVVREKFVAPEHDLIRVKRKTLPVKTYEVLGPIENLDQFHTTRGHLRPIVAT
jgi:hypothetical protein